MRLEDTRKRKDHSGHLGETLYRSSTKTLTLDGRSASW